MLPLHVVDLGKRRSKAVEDLRKGRGRLLDDVADALADVEARLDPAVASDVVPVVMIVERKRKRKSMF